MKQYEPQLDTWKYRLSTVFFVDWAHTDTSKQTITVVHLLALRAGVKLHIKSVLSVQISQLLLRFVHLSGKGALCLSVNFLKQMQFFTEP